jgi:hypothetical protein
VTLVENNVVKVDTSAVLRHESWIPTENNVVKVDTSVVLRHESL